MRIFVGIDGGFSGGIVAIDENQRILHKWVMPIIKGVNTEYDIDGIVEIFDELKRDDNEVLVALEKAAPRAISGKRQCFTNGLCYGLMQGVLRSMGIPYEIVNPSVWMKEMFKGMNTKDKKASIKWCQRRYPKEDFRASERCTTIHDGLTDATVLAIYILRMNFRG